MPARTGDAQAPTRMLGDVLVNALRRECANALSWRGQDQPASRLASARHRRSDRLRLSHLIDGARGARANLDSVGVEIAVPGLGA